MNYENDLAIDPNNLAEEWLQQPLLFMRYSEELAKARKELSLLHEKVKVTRSELVKEVSDNPSLAPGGKATMQTVEAYYRNHWKHKQAQTAMIEQEFAVNLLEGAVAAFAQRKIDLENLVKLWLGQYFARPKKPFDLPEGKRLLKREEVKATQTSINVRQRLQRGR